MTPRRFRASRILVLAAVAAIFGVTACGGDQDEDDITSALGDVQQAFADGDLDSICDKLGPGAQEQVISAGHGRSKSCAQGMRLFAPGIRKRSKQLDATDPEVEGVVITAVATVSNGRGSTTKVRFRKDGDDWKLDTLFGVAPKESVRIK